MCIRDRDKVDQEGKLHYFPHFKSDYNPDLLHTNNYICHFFAVKTSIIKKVGGFRPNFDGAQDFDLVLRCIDAVSYTHLDVYKRQV